jgi:hypothetical protein
VAARRDSLRRWKGFKYGLYKTQHETTGVLEILGKFPWSHGRQRDVETSGVGHQEREGGDSPANLIQHALPDVAIRRHADYAGFDGEVGDLQVLGNEISGLDDESGSQGFLEREGAIWTAGDKVKVVRGVLERRGGRSVYVGDGVGDLGALLEVDCGIYLAGEGEGELQGVVERCGVRRVRTGEWGDWVGFGVRRRVLFEAGGFGEIGASGVVDGMVP